jgi:hypothetical protein
MHTVIFRLLFIKSESLVSGDGKMVGLNYSVLHMSSQIKLPLPHELSWR